MSLKDNGVYTFVRRVTTNLSNDIEYRVLHMEQEILNTCHVAEKEREGEREKENERKRERERLREI